MLTHILIILTISMTLLILLPRMLAKRTERRQPVFICDVCDSQDCLCRKKR